MAYSAAEASDFVGRDADSDKLASLVQAYTTTLLHAASGAGKSSLVAAGLVPELEEMGYRTVGPLRVTPTSESAAGVRHSAHVNPYLVGAALSAGGTGAESMLQILEGSDVDGLHTGQPCVVIFDQFEEILSICEDYEIHRRAFMQEMQATVDLRPNVRMLFVVRDDQLGPVLRLGHDLDGGFAARMHLGSIRREAAEQLLTKPAEAHGKEFEPGLVEEVIRESARERFVRTRPSTKPASATTVSEHVDLVSLQVVAKTLWQASSDQTLIKKHHLRASGDFSGALQRYFELGVSDAATGSRSEQRIRGLFGSRLVSPLEQRQLVAVTEAADAIGPAALSILEERAIVRRLHHGPGYVELCHDSFVTPIRRSNAEWREHRRTTRLFAVGIAAFMIGLVALIAVLLSPGDDGAAPQLELGRPVSGAVDNGGSPAQFRYAGVEAAVVVLTVTAEGDLQPSLEVLDRGGQRLGRAVSASGQTVLTFVVPDDEPVDVYVRGVADSTGPFVVLAEEVIPEEIRIGDSVTRPSPMAGSDVFVLAGEVGERLAVSLRSQSFDGSVKILNPMLDSVASSELGPGLQVLPLVLSHRDQHLIVVSRGNDQSGSYTLGVDPLVAEPIDLGTSVVGEFSTLAPHGMYELISGDEALAALELTTDAGGGAIEVWDRSGARLTSAATNGPVELDVPLASGSYFVFVRAVPEDLGAYRLRVRPVTAISMDGQLEVESLEARDVALFSIVGEHGSALRITLELDDDMDGALALTSPNGEELTSIDRNSGTREELGTVLPVDGQYRIAVTNRGENAGGFKLRVGILEPQELPAFRAVEGTVVNAGDLVVFSFSGTRDNAVYLSAAADDGGLLDAVLELEGPDGPVTVVDQTGGGGLEELYAILPLDGEYQVRVRGGGDSSGEFVLRREAIPTLHEADRLSGALEVDETLTYRFDVSASQPSVLVLSAGDTLDAALTLIDIEGERIRYVDDDLLGFLGGLEALQADSASDRSYFVKVRQVGSSSGAFDISRLPIRIVEPGDPLAVDIAGPSDIQAFAVSIPPSQAMDIAVVPADDLDVSLFVPPGGDGRDMVAQDQRRQGPETVFISGDEISWATVLVSGTQAGEFSVRATALSPLQISLNESVGFSGSSTQQSFSYSASEGEALMLSATIEDGGPGILQLLDGSGQLVTEARANGTVQLANLSVDANEYVVRLSREGSELGPGAVLIEPVTPRSIRPGESLTATNALMEVFDVEIERGEPLLLGLELIGDSSADVELIEPSRFPLRIHVTPDGIEQVALTARSSGTVRISVQATDPSSFLGVAVSLESGKVEDLAPAPTSAIGPDLEPLQIYSFDLADDEVARIRVTVATESPTTVEVWDGFSFVRSVTAREGSPAEFDVRATRDGLHRIIIRGSGGGPFEVDISSVDAGILEVGRASGSVIGSGVAVYDLVTSPGDILRLVLTSLTESTARIGVVDGIGTSSLATASMGSRSVVLHRVAAETDQLRVFVSASSSQAVDFELTAEVIEPQELTVNELLSGEIHEPADLDVFSIRGDAGVAVSAILRPGRGLDGVVEFVAPSGDSLGRSDSSIGGREVASTVLTPQGGLLLLVAGIGQSAGAYQIEVVELPSQALNLGPLATTLDGSIDGPADIDVFEFAATEGDLLAVTVVADGELDATLELLDAQGERSSYKNRVGRREFMDQEIESSGVYRLIIRGSFGSTGSYDLELVAIEPPDS